MLYGLLGLGLLSLMALGLLWQLGITITLSSFLLGLGAVAAGLGIILLLVVLLFYLLAETDFGGWVWDLSAAVFDAIVPDWGCGSFGECVQFILLFPIWLIMVIIAAIVVLILWAIFFGIALFLFAMAAAPVMLLILGLPITLASSFAIAVLFLSLFLVFVGGI